MERLRFVPFDTSYLDRLNTEQRRAVENGSGTDKAPPLLVIAGAVPARPTPWFTGSHIWLSTTAIHPASCCLRSPAAPQQKWVAGWNICSAGFWEQALAELDARKNPRAFGAVVIH